MLAAEQKRSSRKLIGHFVWGANQQRKLRVASCDSCTEKHKTIDDVLGIPAVSAAREFSPPGASQVWALATSRNQHEVAIGDDNGSCGC